MFDLEESPKTRLRPRQYILEPETYIIDERGISYGTLGVCHIWKTFLGGGGGGGGDNL